MPPRGNRVLRVDGPLVIEWPDGMRIRIEPGREGTSPAASGAAAEAKGRPGRKPSPATLRLIEAMQADHNSGSARSTGDYVQLLLKEDPKKSEGSARQIVLREAKRVFGGPLGRARRGTRSGRKGGGRQPGPHTAILRQRLQEDKQKGDLRDAKFYVRWLVDQPGVKMGLKGLRPLVYRELRQAKS
jgi:hypothetical protein